MDGWMDVSIRFEQKLNHPEKEQEGIDVGWVNGKNHMSTTTAACHPIHIF